MSESVEVLRSVIDVDASQLAFRVGQSLERILVDRAVQFAVGEAVSNGRAVVTVDHVRRALNDALLAEACSQLGVVFDGEAKSQRRRSTAG